MTKFIRVYRVSLGWRIFMVIVGIPAIACFVGLMYMSLQNEKFPDALSVGLLILGLAMGVGLALGILDMLKSTLSFSEEGIRIDRLFGAKEVAFTEFKGMTSDENYVYLHPQDETQKRFKISTYFAKEPEWYRLLISLYPELDQLAIERSTSQLHHDEEYGTSLQERLTNKTRLKKTIGYFDTLTWTVILWILIYPYPYQLVTGVALALPIIAWALIIAQRGRLKIIELKNSVYPTLVTPILLPPLFIMLRVLTDYTILSYENAWLIALYGPPLLLIALLAGAKNAFFQKEKRIRIVHAILLFLYTGFSFFFMSCSVNCTFDKSPTTSFFAQVTSMYPNDAAKESDHYKITLKALETQPKELTVSFSKSMHQRLNLGDTIIVNKKPGLLAMPWLAGIELVQHYE